MRWKVDLDGLEFLLEMSARLMQSGSGKVGWGQNLDFSLHNLGQKPLSVAGQIQYTLLDTAPISCWLAWSLRGESPSQGRANLGNI